MPEDVHTANTLDLKDRPLGVLVGYDGSDQAVQALVYAARAASRAGSALTIATAYPKPPETYPNIGSNSTIPEDRARRKAAEDLLETAKEKLAGYTGEILTRVERGDAAGAMVRLSADASLAVVGARGRGGFLGRLLGTVSSALPAHAHCPTVVVPRSYDIGEEEDRFAPVVSDAPVIVGVDRSDHSHLAMRIAARSAQARGTSVHIVVVMPPPENWGGWYAALVPGPDIVERERQELAAEVEELGARLSEEFDGLPVTSEVLISDAATELIERSGRAQLTVVGTRGHGRLASALLGSVSRSLLMHAEGPVMVVPDLESVRKAGDPRRPR